MLQIPDSRNQLFEVRVYNKTVRALVKQNLHHHFFDEDTHELIDCDESDIDKINIKKNYPHCR